MSDSQSAVPAALDPVAEQEQTIEHLREENGVLRARLAAAEQRLARGRLRLHHLRTIIGDADLD